MLKGGSHTKSWDKRIPAKVTHTSLSQPRLATRTGHLVDPPEDVLLPDSTFPLQRISLVPFRTLGPRDEGAAGQAGYAPTSEPSR